MPVRPATPCGCKRYCGDLPEGLDDRLAVCKGLSRWWMSTETSDVFGYVVDVPESGDDND